MRSPAGDKKGLVPFLLYSASLAYGAVVDLRNFLYDRGIAGIQRLPVKVISVGNMTVGGTGKTPMTAYIAALLKKHGLESVIVSRGYRGKWTKSGGIVSDGENILCGPAEAGDEPFLLALRLPGVPVAVGADRVKAARMMLDRFAPDVIILDDGFQHRRLSRDIDIVLADCTNPFGNGRLVPAGILREKAHGVKRAHAVVFTRCPEGCLRAETESKVLLPLEEVLKQGISFFMTRHVPLLAAACPISDPPPSVAMEYAPADSGKFAGTRVLAFAGIADCRSFFTGISKFPWNILKTISFPDHYDYSTGDIKGIITEAERNRAEILVTTEKDWVKVAGRVSVPFPVVVMGVRIVFCREDEAGFESFIIDRLGL